MDGCYWPTSEHYFQAQKFVGTPHADQIRLVKTPKNAANMGRDRSRPLRADWEQVKFYQNLKAGLTVIIALNTAQTWLKNATKEELINQLDLNAAQRVQLMGELRNSDANTKPFESPYHWAAFCAIGQ